MPEARIFDTSTTDSPYQLLLHQRLLIRCLCQGRKDIGSFNPAYFGEPEAWDSLFEKLCPLAMGDSPISGLASLPKHRKHELLMEAAQAVARTAHTHPHLELFGITDPQEYFLDDLYKVRNEITKAAVSFPNILPGKLMPDKFWQDFWNKYLEALSKEFWIWCVMQPPVSMDPSRVWDAFGEAAQKSHETYANFFGLTTFCWQNGQGVPTPSLLGEALRCSYKKGSVSNEMVDDWLYHDAFNNFLSDLGSLPINRTQLLVKLDAFMASECFKEVEEVFISNLEVIPTEYEAVVYVAVNSPIDLLQVKATGMSFSFCKTVHPGKKYQLSAKDNVIFAYFPAISLAHYDDAAELCIPPVRQVLDQISYLANREIDWRVLSIFYRKKTDDERIGWGFQRFDSPHSINVKEIEKGFSLFAEILNRRDDTGRRCERALRYWALAKLTALNPEECFINLWAIVDIINPKAASGECLGIIMPIYWLQQKFPNENKEVLEQEYLKIRESFRKLWDMRSRGIIHREKPSWEPRALAIWTTLLKDYIEISLKGIFYHQLNCKKGVHSQILDVVKCMMDEACNRGLPTKYRIELLRKISK